MIDKVWACLAKGSGERKDAARLRQMFKARD
jgi:hypothetical protein